jgi:hypothetical protein
MTYVASGTATSAQTANDCQKNQCDGSGNIVSVADNTDLPLTDNNSCTNDTCVTGAPVHTPVAVGTSCTEVVGGKCNALGTCVQCVTGADCTQPTNECELAATCSNGTCGMTYAASGTATTAQTANDCKKNQCDGAGNIISVTDATDTPASDGNSCTNDTCVGSTPLHVQVNVGDPCTEIAGGHCDASATCVQCTTASQCPQPANECQTAATCISGVCGMTYAANHTLTAAQTANDCHKSECDGSGNIASVVDDSDLPAPDANVCHGVLCTAGVPSHPNLPVGTSCGSNLACDSAAACIAPPKVTATAPVDPAAAPPTSTPATTTISATFSSAVTAASVTGQTLPGACSGSFQVSYDDFASCVPFSSAAATMSGNTATFTAAPGLLVNRTYKIRVTTGVTGTTGLPLQAQFTSGFGFTTANPLPASSGVVIAQVYPAGGSSSASTYKYDYVVLHNRGTTAADLTGMSIQYGSASSTSTWSGVGALTSAPSLPAGGYMLIQLGTAGTNAASINLTDVSQTFATISMSAAGGKVALVTGATAIVSGSDGCPNAASLTKIVDWVGYGTANCGEGGSVVAAPGLTTAAIRNVSGCVDTNANSADLTVATATPKGISATGFTCSAPLNESGTLAEIDFEVLQYPSSFTGAPGSTFTVYGRIYDTDSGGTKITGGTTANPLITAQLGYAAANSDGSPKFNPEYEAGWTWIGATFNATCAQGNGGTCGNNDEYQATLTLPATGKYVYTYRFSIDGGSSWTYADVDGSGANGSLAFDMWSYVSPTLTPLLGVLTAN